MEKNYGRITFQVLDVSCLQCVIGIRGLLEKQSGIIEIKVNSMLNIFYVDYDPEKISGDDIEKIVKKIGYKLVRLRSMRELY